jgi:uncharacterized membrane protein YeaQ/YmgE (transglycosylase-associated protein family)
MSWLRGYSFEDLPWLTKANVIAGIVAFIVLGFIGAYYFGDWVVKKWRG